jgi:DNA-binding transcriptional LysR family regulator
MLNRMAIFAKVIEKASFTDAALDLGVSKSVVSKQVTQLENHLGVRLLNRTTRRLSLTEAGEVFYQHCLRVVAEAKEAESAVMPLQTEPKGVLHISAPHSLAITLLPQALLHFQALYPEIELDIHISGHFIDLIKEGVDVALRIGKLADSTLKARRLAPCHFIVCAAPQYWKQHGKPQHPHALSGFNCLLYTQSTGANHWQFIDASGENIMVTVKGSMRIDEGRLLLDTALAGAGVIYSPSIMLQPYIDSGELEPVLVEYSIDPNDLYAIYPYSQHVSPKVRLFVDFLTESWKGFS